MYIVEKIAVFCLLIFLLVICLFAINRRWHMKMIIIIGVIFSLGIIVISISVSWIHPVKYAIEEKEFENYAEYILVREVHYTGTGWSMIGDTDGYFSDSEIVDVILEGEELPEANTPAEHYNVFLCNVEYKGEKEHEAFADKVGCYVVKDWYPVYPIVRNRLLPQVFYPGRYMTERDIKGY